MLAFYLAVLESPDDKTTFETLYIKYRNQMFYLAKTLLSDDVAAEDAVHDVFVAVASKYMETVRKIENEEDLRNYLLKAAKNTCLNYIRKQDRMRIPLDPVLASGGMNGKAVSDESFWEHIHNCVEAERVVLAITDLPAIYRDVVYYHFVVGLTGKEIANSLDEKLSTVKKRLIRGKVMLLQSLNTVEGSDKL